MVEANYNDQYYDLDDNFIDDDMMVAGDEMGVDLHIQEVYSEPTEN